MKTLEFVNGAFVSMAVVEVTSVPFFELFFKRCHRLSLREQLQSLIGMLIF